jgi:hypothetical protein
VVSRVDAAHTHLRIVLQQLQDRNHG